MTNQLIKQFNYNQLATETSIVVQQRTGEIKTLIRRTAQDIIDIGCKLIEVKEKLPHGTFGGWLETEFGWSDRTARNYMNVAETFKTETVSDLNIQARALYLLAADSTPPEAREEVLQAAQQNGTKITHKAAKIVVDQHKTPPQEKEQLTCFKCGAALEPIDNTALACSCGETWDSIRTFEQEKAKTIEVEERYCKRCGAYRVFNKFEMEYAPQLVVLCKRCDISNVPLSWLPVPLEKPQLDCPQCGQVIDPKQDEKNDGSIVCTACTKEFKHYAMLLNLAQVKTAECEIEMAKTKPEPKPKPKAEPKQTVPCPLCEQGTVAVFNHIGHVKCDSCTGIWGSWQSHKDVTNHFQQHQLEPSKEISCYLCGNQVRTDDPTMKLALYCPNCSKFWSTQENYNTAEQDYNEAAKSQTEIPLPDPPARQVNRATVGQRVASLINTLGTSELIEFDTLLTDKYSKRYS